MLNIKDFEEKVASNQLFLINKDFTNRRKYIDDLNNYNNNQKNIKEYSNKEVSKGNLLNSDIKNQKNSIYSKLELRKLKNKISAKKSRDNVKKLIFSLENINRELKKENGELKHALYLNINHNKKEYVCLKCGYNNLNSLSCTYNSTECNDSYSIFNESNVSIKSGNIKFSEAKDSIEINKDTNYINNNDFYNASYTISSNTNSLFNSSSSNFVSNNISKISYFIGVICLIMIVTIFNNCNLLNIQNKNYINNKSIYVPNNNKLVNENRSLIQKDSIIRNNIYEYNHLFKENLNSINSNKLLDNSNYTSKNTLLFLPNKKKNTNYSSEFKYVKNINNNDINYDLLNLSTSSSIDVFINKQRTNIIKKILSDETNKNYCTKQSYYIDNFNRNDSDKSILPFYIAKSKGLIHKYNDYNSIISKNTGSIVLTDKALLNSFIKLDYENFNSFYNYNSNTFNPKDSKDDNCFFLHLIIPSYILEYNNIINNNNKYDNNNSFWEIGCKIFEFSKVKSN